MNSQSHYEAHTADSYESAFFYEQGAYTKYLCDLVAKRLGLTKDSTGTLVDIGGGTGNFTRMLVDQAPKMKAIVVDPFLAESTTSSANDSIQFVKASAEAYMEEPDSSPWRQGYRQVLMKEVVHHLDAKDRVAIFKGMAQGVEKEKQSNVPSLLIITRPQKDIDYPLWKEAREIWANNQPSAEEFTKDLIQAGFNNVESTIEAYPCDISFQRWQAMVQKRFWSTFANFTDDELKAACQTMERDEAHRIDDQGIIRFEDRLVFLHAFV